MGVLIIFTAGLGLLVCGLYATWKYSPKKWHVVSAVVIHNKAMAHPGRYGPLYSPYVRYRYEANGILYHGDCYAYSTSEDLGTLESVGKILQQYAEGTTISVWHQPRNPSLSCIKLKSSYSRSQMSALIVAGVLVIGVGVAVLVAGST